MKRSNLRISRVAGEKMDKVSFAFFLLLPLGTLALRERFPGKRGWLLSVLVQILLGWALLCVSVEIESREINGRMEMHQATHLSISDEMRAEWASMDAPRIVAYVLGGLISPAYFVAWLPFYWLYRNAKKRKFLGNGL